MLTGSDSGTVVDKKVAAYDMTVIPLNGVTMITALEPWTLG